MAIDTPVQKPNLINQIKDLSRRVALLERVNQLGRSALQRGALRILAGDNKLAVKIGELSDSGVYRGVFLYDADEDLSLAIANSVFGDGLFIYNTNTGNATVLLDNTPGLGSRIRVRPANSMQAHFEVSDQGIIHPVYHLPAYEANNFVPVTSGSFTTVWQGGMVGCPSPAVGFDTQAGCDPGTTGEARLVMNHSGGTSTSGVQSLSAGTFTSINYRWDHGVELRDSFTIELQARRTGGAGNVNVYSGFTGFYFSGVTELSATATGL